MPSMDPHRTVWINWNPNARMVAVEAVYPMIWRSIALSRIGSEEKEIPTS
jgi:hypothetical protein